MPAAATGDLVQRRADVELAERAEVRAAADRVPYGEAMTLVLAEDEALASRYYDYCSGSTAVHELAARAGQIVESHLLVNMEGLQRRWKEPLVIIYPDPITWFDFPYAIYMGKETTALEKNAALEFKRYLLTDDLQRTTLRFGLRPASPNVPAQGEGSLIARWASMGFLENVPSASRMRPAPRTGLTDLAAWFQKRYEQ